MPRGLLGSSLATRNRLTHRTSRLPWPSKVLYRIEHYSSLPSVAIAIIAAAAGPVSAMALMGLPNRLVASFQIGASAITVVMVFAIQHTQGREQAATQRKLDELLRALPGADEGLMMLEEAPQEVLLDIEDGHRHLHSD